MEQGNLDEALSCYDRAIALEADAASVHAGRGAALSRAGRHREALQAFETALSCDPGYLRHQLEFSEDYARSRAAISKKT